MILKFNIDYRTHWGENVYLTGNIPQLGNGDPAHALKLELYGEQTWQIVVNVPASCKEFTYGYFIRNEKGEIHTEWGKGHHFRAGEGVTNYLILDRWSDQPYDKPYYSTVFTGCVCRRDNRAKAPEIKTGDLLIAVDAPMIHPDEAVAITGNCKALGNWDPAKAVVLSDAFYPTWEAAVSRNELPEDIEFKFLIIKKESGKLVDWEGGENRRLSLRNASSAEVVTTEGMRLINPLTPWRGAGVAIPVFSLRSEGDWGVGEFLDLEKMIDWAVKTGQRFIQVLPVNDTTMTHSWTDSYPYNANSCFALHPMYLRMKELGTLKDETKQKEFEAKAAELNALEQIDYEQVNNLKDAYTDLLFAQVNKSVVRTKAFKDFVSKNSEWLKPYAAFCILRDQYGTPDMSKWEDMAFYSPEKVDKFITDHTYEANKVYWIQMNLAKQLSQVRDYAHAHGVALKGDIPIGISRTSVDAWIAPELFNLNSQAGAPPDDFSVLGQNWGFPTYNWEEMYRKDRFAWWKNRFRNMSQYFDVYRIDHVLGFFRIWQIPLNQLHGLLGVFNPALPFTPDELRNNYDFWLDVDLQTTPFAREEFLADFFGEYAAEARERFFNPAGNGRLRLKQEFDDQRKVAEYFGSLPNDEKNTRLCNGLQGIIDQVLFIEDPVEKGKYHPRISAQFTYNYRYLTDYERWTFDRLYNDFFYHRHNDFWYGKAMWKLPPLIDATSMLTCAEDLGMIPDCVPAVMNALEILTLDIQRMPKDPSVEFGDPAHYPYLTVCTTSTHDMGGIRQWWEENPEKTQHFFNHMLHEGGSAPFFAEPWICEKIVDSNLKSPAMLCILPLQDWLSIDGKLRRANPNDEQINVPANSRHYWRYRMHLSLEDLLIEDLFNKRVASLVENSGR